MLGKVRRKVLALVSKGCLKVELVMLWAELLAEPVTEATACIAAEARFALTIELLEVILLVTFPPIPVSIRTSSIPAGRLGSTCFCVCNPFIIHLYFLAYAHYQLCDNEQKLYKFCGFKPFKRKPRNVPT
jgi:hypothetical protein